MCFQSFHSMLFPSLGVWRGMSFGVSSGQLLDASADKDKGDRTGRRPVHLAARLGHQQVARCLLEARADRDEADNDGLLA